MHAQGSGQAQQPSISVVIPAYNAGPYLAECLESVFAQTRAPLEVIVVDDGSTDDTYAVAQRFPVRPLRTDGRQGNLIARALGVGTASGDYVAMVDADDYWAPDHLETTGALLDRFPEAGYVGAHAQEFGHRSGLFRAQMPTDAPGDVFWQAFASWHVPYNALVARREALQRAFTATADIPHQGSDYLVTLRLAHAHRAMASGRATAYWRRHDSQLSAAPGRQHSNVHRHRARFISEVRDGETPERVREMELRALKAWIQACRSARDEPDLMLAYLRVRRHLGAVPRGIVVWGYGRAHLGRWYDSPALAPLRAVIRLCRRHLPGHLRHLTGS